ncbi:MAG: hypothetical protein ACO24H_10335, partial [Polynucleobacter sp.]
MCGAAMRGDAARETEKPAADLPPVLLFSPSVGMKLFEILISAPSSRSSGIRYQFTIDSLSSNFLYFTNTGPR